MKNDRVKLLLILLLVLTSCYKEEAESPDEESNRWERFEIFKFEKKVAHDAKYFKPYLWVNGPGMVLRLEMMDSIKKLSKITLQGKHSIDEEVSMNEDVFLSPNESRIIFYNTNDFQQFGNSSIDMKDFDENFKEFLEVYPYSNPASINSQNEILIPYNTTHDDLKFLFLKIREDQDKNFKVIKSKIFDSPGINFRKIDFLKFNGILGQDQILVFYDGTYSFNQKNGFQKMTEYKLMDHWSLNDRIYAWSNDFLHVLNNREWKNSSGSFK